MHYIRQFIQETVHEETKEAFDLKMNRIFEKTGDRNLEVHYFDNLGLCATVRYWSEKQIPETIAEEYECRGDGYICSECPLYKPSNDKRVKYSYCEHAGTRVGERTRACNYFYENLLEDKVCNI